MGQSGAKLMFSGVDMHSGVWALAKKPNGIGFRMRVQNTSLGVWIRIQAFGPYAKANPQVVMVRGCNNENVE